ncbi:MAG: ABC transporter permease subunit [bacterium]|nr:ABC transporter permease subunit [bacterium]
MLNLIKNEYIKIFKKKSTIIWLAILLVISLGLLFLSSMELDMTEYYSDNDYMSESYVNDQLNSYTTIEDKTYPDYFVLMKVKELGMYNLENWIYDELYSAADLLSVGTNEANRKLFDEAAVSLKSGNPTDYVKVMANQYKPNTYTFPGSDKAVTNPYQYCLDQSINPKDDPKLFSCANNLLSLQDQLERIYTSTGENSTNYKNKYNSYLVLNKLLDEKQTDAIIDNAITNNMDSSSDMSIVGSMGMSSSMNLSSTSSKFWNVLQLSASFVTMIQILMLIIAGSCVATEFSSGTIKFLLINPINRRKIIISKYLMVVSFSFFCVVGYYIICVLFSLILGGADHLGASYITASNGSVTMYSGFLYVAKLYLYAFIDIICYGTLAFALSSLFRNSAIAIGISIALSISGSIITGILSMINQDWGRYLFFANTDLATIQAGNSLFPNQTMTFAIIVIIVHMIVLLWTAYDGFTRREV